MEWKLQTESVIARLMGLDQLRPGQRVCGNRRVLSEGYIRKAATVGVRRGSLVSMGRSCGSVVESVKDASRIEALEGKSHFDCYESDASNASTVSGILKPSGASILNSLTKTQCEDKRLLTERDSCCTQANGLRYVEKTEGGRGFDHANKTLKLGSEVVMTAASKDPNLEKVMCGFKDGISDRHSKVGYREQSDSLQPQRRDHHHALMSEKLVVGDITSHQCSRVECAENTNKCGSSKIAVLSIPVGNVDLEIGHASPVSPSQLSPKKQIFERWTTRIKVVRRIDFSEKSTSPKMLALAEKESTFGKGKDSLINGWSMKQHCSAPEYKSLVDILELNGGTNCDQFQTYSSVNVTLSPHSKISANIQGIHNEKNNGSENSVPEAMGNEFSEELPDTNSSRIGTPEFQENLKRANQNSPNSVLKPFYGEGYSNDQGLDSIGLQLQLQVLNLEAGDSCSEESVTCVFGDDDSLEQVVDPSPDGKRVRRWLGDTESRNFSYMVDVLDEAGLSGTKPCLDSKTWHSLASSISPTVFEALEKKHGKQASWEKSDRRLLFDSINASLLSIFDPVIMNFNLSIKGFLSANLSRNEVEDKLWTILIRQETDRRNSSSEKVLEQWIETNEGMSIICTELASSLFDELVEELAVLLIC